MIPADVDVSDLERAAIRATAIALGRATVRAAATEVRRRAWQAGWDDALNELHELGVSLSERERRALDRRRNELADLA